MFIHISSRVGTIGPSAAVARREKFSSARHVKKFPHNVWWVPSSTDQNSSLSCPCAKRWNRVFQIVCVLLKPNNGTTVGLVRNYLHWFFISVTGMGYKTFPDLSTNNFYIRCDKMLSVFSSRCALKSSGYLCQVVVEAVQSKWKQKYDRQRGAKFPSIDSVLEFCV